ncbi:DUF6483 family protein [Paenibacillus thermoaerophilus]
MFFFEGAICVYQRDYILRLIEQMTGMLGKMLGLQHEEKHEEALTLIDETLKRMFGLNRKLIGGLPERELLELLQQNGLTDNGKLWSVAKLLDTEADSLEELGDADAAERSREKSLYLLLVLHRQDPGEALQEEVSSAAESLLIRLNAIDLPTDTLELLFPYLEETGRFAKAEDVLFELLERADSESERAKRIESGRAFYERLAALDEERLSAGGLSPEEVRQGLSDLQEARA